MRKPLLEMNKKQRLNPSEPPSSMSQHYNGMGGRSKLDEFPQPRTGSSFKIKQPSVNKKASGLKTFSSPAFYSNAMHKSALHSLCFPYLPLEAEGPISEPARPSSILDAVGDILQPGGARGVRVEEHLAITGPPVAPFRRLSHIDFRLVATAET